MEKYIVICLTKEWYGCETNIGDPACGRYKNKGSQEFIFEADEAAMYREWELIANFNAKYDRVGRFYRYEAKSIDWYSEPVVAKFVDGEIIIPFTDSLDGTSV